MPRAIQSCLLKLRFPYFLVTLGLGLMQSIIKFLFYFPHSIVQALNSIFIAPSMGTLHPQHFHCLFFDFLFFKLWFILFSLMFLGL